MAITIIDRPRILAYFTGGSPAEAVYSTWNAGWNPIVYSFNVLVGDVLSSLVMTIYEVGTNTLLASNTIRPFKTGTWNVDISPYVRAYLFSEYKPNFTVNDNSKDLGGSLNFYINYTQIFDNNIPSIFNSEQTKPITVSCSAMQFGDVNGGNNIKYNPFGHELSEDKKMKFLTLFDTPVMWEGWPFSMSFIYSLNIIGVQNIKTEIQEDVNGNQLNNLDTILDPSQIGSINYLKVSQPDQQNTKFILLELKTGEAITSTYVDDGYVDSGYTKIQ